MLHSLYDTVTHLLTHSPDAYFILYGLLAIGIAGIPLPDELMLSYVGYLSHKGNLCIFLAIVAASLGSSTGLTISYLLGRMLGYPLVARYGRYFFISPDRLQRAHTWFDNRGKWTITFSIFLPSIRHVLALAAGTSRMEMKSFAFFAYVGSFIWATTFICVGFGLGTQFPALRGKWEALSNEMHSIILVVVGVVVGLFIAYQIFRRISSFRAKRAG